MHVDKVIKSVESFRRGNKATKSIVFIFQTPSILPSFTHVQDKTEKGKERKNRRRRKKSQVLGNVEASPSPFPFQCPEKSPNSLTISMEISIPQTAPELSIPLQYHSHEDPLLNRKGKGEHQENQEGPLY